MEEANGQPLQAILISCARSAPNPWYPADFAEATGLPRERLDALLDELRLGGLVRLTDWVQGRGQGYTLTPEGQEVVNNPRLLEKLAPGGVARKPAPPALVAARPRAGMNAWERGEAIRSALLYRTTPVVTYGLILANVAVFLAGLMLAHRRQMPLNDFIAGSHPEILEATGAVSWYSVLDGQWWRLVTANFVHIGALHLGMNMYALYILGPLVERLFGHVRYLVLYLVAGFGSTCIGVLFQLGCAGASGAICGLLAAILAWTFLNRHSLPAPLVASWYRVILINTVLILIISAMPKISWSGHLGGALVGLAAAALLNYQRFGFVWQRALATVGLLLLPVVCYAVLLQAPKFNKEWERRFQLYQQYKKLRQLQDQTTLPPAERALARMACLPGRAPDRWPRLGRGVEPPGEGRQGRK
jgi:membrane associated rhomboid family serine protease